MLYRLSAKQTLWRNQRQQRRKRTREEPSPVAPETRQKGAKFSEILENSGNGDSTVERCLLEELLWKNSASCLNSKECDSPVTKEPFNNDVGEEKLNGSTGVHIPDVHAAKLNGSESLHKSDLYMEKLNASSGVHNPDVQVEKLNTDLSKRTDRLEGENIAGDAGETQLECDLMIRELFYFNI